MKKYLFVLLVFSSMTAYSASLDLKAKDQCFDTIADCEEISIQLYRLANDNVSFKAICSIDDRNSCPSGVKLKTTIRRVKRLRIELNGIRWNTVSNGPCQKTRNSLGMIATDGVSFSSYCKGGDMKGVYLNVSN